MYDGQSAPGIRKELAPFDDRDVGGFVETADARGGLGARGDPRRMIRTFFRRYGRRLFFMDRLQGRTTLNVLPLYSFDESLDWCLHGRQ